MARIALIPVYRSEGSIGTTVRATAAIPGVDQVVVIDDGSGDATPAEAAAAGARVLTLRRNGGKGGALAVGVAATPDADYYLLVDADLGDTAGGLAPLIGPVQSGAADLTIGTLPAAGGRGGFGVAKKLARWGIRRAAGFEAAAPLSGQRCIRGPLLRSLVLAPRFGTEVGATIDALRLGSRVLEIPVQVDHHHRGRGRAGFSHRGRQALDIWRALWPRLTSRRLRLSLIAATFLVASVLALWSGNRAEPESVPLAQRADRVFMVGFPGLSFDELTPYPTDYDFGQRRAFKPKVPNLKAMIRDGAVAAMSVRTRSGRPSTAEGYATLGAGVRVDADTEVGLAFNASERVEGRTALEAAEARFGFPAYERLREPEVLAVGALASAPDLDVPDDALGALGNALARAGLQTAVIGNADTGPQLVTPRPPQPGPTYRPVAVALMDIRGSVDFGDVGSGVLRQESRRIFNRQADLGAIRAQVERVTAAGADVILVDPGDLDRTAAAALSTPALQASFERSAAMDSHDAALGGVRRIAGPNDLVMAFGITPPGNEWHLTPFVIEGPGVTQGQAHSPSTRREGVVTLTDIAPTILDALDADIPAGMIGHPLRYRDTASDLTGLENMDSDASYREGIYLPLTLWYIGIQAALYLFAIWAIARSQAGRAAPWLRWAVVSVAAYPLATFLHRALPGVSGWGPLGVALVPGLALALGAVALRAKRHPLSPVAWLAGLTVAVLAIDVATGAHLQNSSLLGYSVHTAARFTGFGNTAFATLAATAVVAGALHVHHAPRRREAVFTVALFFAFVLLIDGSPSLGSDVGGILTLVPVLGLTLVALGGRRVNWKAVVGTVGLTALALGGAIAIDLSRAPESRTHLGRLVGDIASDGSGPLASTIARKLATNFRTWSSPWTWAIVVLVAYLLIVLVIDRGWDRLLPRRSALRAAVTGTLAAGLIGYAVNDSGVVVAALVFVYLGPFLTLLALDVIRDEEKPLTHNTPEAAWASG